jgi:hypothetical protein
MVSRAAEVSERRAARDTNSKNLFQTSAHSAQLTRTVRGHPHSPSGPRDTQQEAGRQVRRWRRSVRPQNPHRGRRHGPQEPSLPLCRYVARDLSRDSENIRSSLEISFSVSKRRERAQNRADGSNERRPGTVVSNSHQGVGEVGVGSRHVRRGIVCDCWMPLE